MLFQLLFIAHIMGCFWHGLYVNMNPLDPYAPTNWLSYAGLYKRDEHGNAIYVNVTEDDDEADWALTETPEGTPLEDRPHVQQLVQSDLSLRYCASIYWAFTTMTTVGYGDINTSNDTERVFCIFAMLVGASVFGYVIGNVTVMMESFDMQAAFLHEKMDRVKEYLRDRKFPSLIIFCC